MKGESEIVYVLYQTVTLSLKPKSPLLLRVGSSFISLEGTFGLEHRTHKYLLIYLLKEF